MWMAFGMRFCQPPFGPCKVIRRVAVMSSSSPRMVYLPVARSLLQKTGMGFLGCQMTQGNLPAHVHASQASRHSVTSLQHNTHESAKNCTCSSSILQNLLVPLFLESFLLVPFPRFQRTVSLGWSPSDRLLRGFPFTRCSLLRFPCVLGGQTTSSLLLRLCSPLCLTSSASMVNIKSIWIDPIFVVNSPYLSRFHYFTRRDLPNEFTVFLWETSFRIASRLRKSPDLLSLRLTPTPFLTVPR